MADQLPEVANIQTDKQGNQFVIVGQYQIKILKNRCIAAASCVAVAPEVFRLNQKRIAEFVAGGQADRQTWLFGAQACPTQAIEIYDLHSGKKLWPTTE